MAIATTNPATGEMLKSFDPMGEKQIERILADAAAAAVTLRATSFDERAAWLREAALLLEGEVVEVARLVTMEMGKPIGEAKAEVTKCAAACRYFATHAEEFLADQPADAHAVGASRAYTRFEPLGPVLAVMPWNFPLWQVMRFAAPNLMVGNPGLLKHASNVPQTALYLDELFERSGFPPGAFQALLVGSDAIENILLDPRVRAATLTGSTPAGRAVAAAAGRALKKTVLELGGSDPFVVLPSADLDAAVATAVKARCQNSGQSCIAAKRFIVHGEVYETFARAFTDRMAALVVGDPLDHATDVGPLATEQVRDDVAAQVDDAVARGATVLTGGRVPDGPGWFYPPTVVTDITRDMRMFGEEVFGPVAGLYRASSVDEALELANATEFGLGSNVWTNDPGERERFVNGLDAGQVFVNGMTTSYPALPFGGVGDSGYGRELSSLGIREFCNAKAVWIG
ncbi:NADP-dependent succinic semialdehyde dehydrogenase [Asanoa siamensis]|uniref:Succinate-semialdehyde dehydrogenase n=1 Tax=Asanoa siamensis TaxID=926357 RepID=A0ABQ4CZ32_9ACTN|nr:NADP-dependent succinic semialdehyde dehydrogenase [Asanoa siamensis]GIF76541.1 succinate-semialdehyde dehydrogenase [Asanoa siamensis]